MRKRMLWVLLLAPLLVGAAPPECASFEAARDRLLNGSFEVSRHLRMSVNGDLKKRELARLAYSPTGLEAEILEEETGSGAFQFDSDGNDPVLSAEVDCERLEALDDGGYRLKSEDGTETYLFALDDDSGSLVPLEWAFEVRERFLFKKFHIEGGAKYFDFERE